MAYDRVLVANTRNWLLKAAKDLRRASLALTPDWADPEDSVFHSGLCRQCAEVDTAFGGWAERMNKLTEYAWKFRYPGEPYEPSVEDAQQALTLAREAYDAVLARLPAEARP